MSFSGKRTHEGQARSAPRKRVRRLIKHRTSGMPTFSVGDQHGWNTLKEATGEDVIMGFVVRYMARLAHMLEAKIAAGGTLETIFASSKREADTEGLSGYQMSTAIHYLEHVWKYRLFLRRLNPAKWLFVGEPGILGGLSNEDELAELVPDVFKGKNPWSTYAMHLFRQGGNISSWKWKSANMQVVDRQYYCFCGLMGSFGISAEGKKAVAGWMLSEMLEEVPEYVAIAA